MKYLFKLIVILTIYFMIFSCDSGYQGTEPPPDPATGDSISYVFDTNGNPVAGAKIVYTLDVNVYESDTGYVIIDQLPEISSIDFRDSVEINYNTEFEDLVTIWIEYNYEDTIIFLVNDVLDSGNHTYYWDKKDSNGKYITNDAYQLWGYGGTTVDSPCFIYKHILYNYEDALENEIHYLTTTDSDGSFDLDSIKIPQYCECTYDSLCWGYKRFSEYVRLWAVKDGMENIYLDSVRLGYDIGVVLKP